MCQTVALIQNLNKTMILFTIIIQRTIKTIKTYFNYSSIYLKKVIIYNNI